MVVVKGLSTFKRRVSGERETRDSAGGVRSFKVYTEDYEVSINGNAAKTKRKSVPVTAETSHTLANSHKDILKKLDKIQGKSMKSSQTTVGRKVLADISNSRNSFLKSDTFDGSKPGKCKTERMPYLQRPSVSSSKDTKVFNNNPKTRPHSQETASHASIKLARTYCPPQRKSLPVLKQVGKTGKHDINKVFNGNSKTRLQGQDKVGDVTRKSLPVPMHDVKQRNLHTKVKNKERHGFSVKPKVGTTIVPQVSSARLKNRFSDGAIKKVLESQPMVGKQRLSRISMKPTVKPAAGIPRAQRVSSSVFTKSTLKTSVIFKKHKETSSSESVSCEARTHCPPERKSLLVPKHDVKQEKLNTDVKSKERHGFSVKPKVGTTVVPQVSNARLKNRFSDGSIKKVSESQPMVGKPRLSRVSMKPTVKPAVGIPRAQRVSRDSSVFSKSTSKTSVTFKKLEETSGSESVSCEASTSKLTTKAKPGRRKSYTSLLIERTELLKDQRSANKEEILPNIYDDGNQLEVAEYVDEIYLHYWVTEASHQSLKNYMEIQTDITPQMRGILINWLIEVHMKFDLMQETLYLMVTLLDYYLCAVTIKRNEMQLVGLTSLLLASKYEDFWHPKVMELISISAEVYTKDQVLGMETMILEKLNFRLNFPTPYVFMLRFLRAAQASKKLENLAFFLIELCLVEYDALQYKPSLLCASAIYVAKCTLHLDPAWTPLLTKHSRYHEFQIRDCAEMILGFHQAARTAVLRVTYDKFMRADKCKVALIKPLDRLPPPL